MSTIHGHKSRITAALGTLTKMISAVDSTYLTPLDTSSTVEIQLRNILRRRGAISAAKLAIERALEILKDRYESLILYIQTQEDRVGISEDIDQFWSTLEGNKHEQDALETITALETQLMMDESIETSLRVQLNDNIATATAALTLSGSPTRISGSINPSSNNNSEQPHQSIGPIATSPVPFMQPIQLRKLELPTFDGDLAQYHDFWCRFKTAVHDNDHLPLSTKFIYLANALKGSAALVIQGFDPSKPENYHLAIQALKKRYDRPHFTHNLFHHKLESLPTSSVSASAQRDTLSQVQSYVLQINRFENTNTSLSLMKIIKKKFPRETQLEVSKLEHRSGKTWTLPELLDGLNEVIEELEKLEDYTIGKNVDFNVNPVSASQSRSPTPELIRDPNACCFCDSHNHRSTQCHHRISVFNRRLIVKQHKLCWKCLRNGHSSSHCGYPKCRQCSGNHHPILCRRDILSSSTSPVSRSRQRYRSQSPDSSRNRRYSRSTSYEGRSQSFPSPSRYRSDSADSPSPRRHRRRSRRDNRVRFRLPVRNNPSVTHNPTQRSSSSLSPPQGHSPSVHHTIQSDEDIEPINNYYNVQLSASTDSMPTYTLMTVEAQVTDRENNLRSPVILLLDTGSQANFIKQDTVDRLKLRVQDQTLLTTVAFGAIRSTEPSGKVHVTLIDQQQYSLPLVLNTKDKITVPTQPAYVTHMDRNILRSMDVSLDSLTALRCVTPDILIGIDYFWDIVTTDTPVTLPSGLVLCYTRFGPTISDETDPISRFDNLNIIGITDDPDPQLDHDEDAKILQRFQDTAYEIKGHLYVQFPWRLSHPRLADNKQLALKRLESQYRTLSPKQDLWQLYADTISDYHRQGIIEEVQEHQSDDSRIYYIPHQAVVKESSSTTKLRVVFDASSHYKGAPSLNDCLHPGPSILPDLVGILLRSRLYPYLLISDVEKAFLQIRLQLDQRDATRFLWLQDPWSPPSDHNIKIFRFTRVPFGITASPFLLAAYILYYLRRDSDNPLNKEIENNTYVDNIILGASTEQEAIRKYQESKALFSSMHMNLRQFLCNSTTVNKAIAPEDRMKSSTTVPLLGIRWNPISDQFLIPFSTAQQEVTTKRTALKALASTFDPLGLLSPFLAPFKILLQDMWSKQYQWDDPLDVSDIQRWNQLVEDIKQPLSPIPRCVIPTQVSTVELCVFGDASKRLYASCVYLLCRTKFSIMVHLVMAKSLLGPRKSTTMPRMELLATLISLRLAKFVYSQLHYNISAVHIFSDSQIVLHWIHLTRPLRVFVNNRIKEIRSIIDHFRSLGISIQFYYVRSESNPADCATRGIPTSSTQQRIWWSGPTFLRQPQNHWPQANQLPSLSEEIKDARKEYQTLTFSPITFYISPIRFQVFSSYNKLVRSTAYVSKFIHNLLLKIRPTSFSTDTTQSTSSMHISVSEFAAAEVLLVKEHYRESEALLNQLPLHKFNAHRSSTGLIHCPHRDQNSLNTPSLPILLVPSHRLTHLIVMHIHRLQLHSGVHATIATLRLSYYIPSIRSTVAKILRTCTVCKKINALPYRYPDIPPLPKERVTRSRPFQNIGLDYLGPLRYKSSLNTPSKLWICLFTCMATRAIHLELVLDNTTQEFLLAFRRFIARRGTPSLVLSDNAATFRSAEDTLQKVIFAQPSFAQVSNYLTSRHIQWKFITPLSPWKGGFYERLVGLVKSALRKSVGRSLLPLQQFTTFVTEVEATLNSRPLTSLPDTVSSPNVLRPVDFLQPQVQLQLPSFTSNSTLYYSHRQLVEWHKETLAVLDRFWTIWSTDYLTAISERHNQHLKQGKSTPRIPQVGEVVLIGDKAISRSSWPLAVITRLTYDSNQQVRSATIRVSNGNQLQRSINQLYPLEIIATEPPDTSDPPIRRQPHRAAKQRRSYRH